MPPAKLAHTPVLLQETLEQLNLKPGMNVIDGTLGLGGHSKAILEKIGSEGRLMAFEQDGRNLKEAKKNLKKYEKQVLYIHDNFETLQQQLEKHSFAAPDAVLLDLGLSSPHLDDPARGFAFMKEGPLDMRFDPRSELTAEIVVNSYSEKALADLIYEYGEERLSRKIARKIVEERKKQRITRTTQLAEIIQKTIKGKTRLHPATLTFQALRIYVNRELEVLEKTLNQAVQSLKQGGIIAVISYHSLEDRMVKTVFRHYAKTCICPPEVALCQCNFKKTLYILTRKPIIPTEIEVSQNPRARSAKLRAAKKL